MQSKREEPCPECVFSDQPPAALTCRSCKDGSNWFHRDRVRVVCALAPAAQLAYQAEQETAEQPVGGLVEQEERKLAADPCVRWIRHAERARVGAAS